MAEQLSEKPYDYIIVGAGAAGVVLAARLSEDPRCRVLLIEAGPSDRSIWVRMPAGLSRLQSDRRRTWPHKSGPERALGDRMIDHVRGRCIGGSGSINGMVFVRGNRRDFDAWAEAGLPDWSYEHCLPYFKRLENFSDGENTYRGSGGPIGVSRCTADFVVMQAFLEAAQQAGHKYNHDYNAARQEGVHVYQANIANGVRASGGLAYLAPTSKRQNLDIRTGMLARRIVFDGLRAVAVEARRGAVTSIFVAEREVILCGGAYNSPQLLLLSGIGNPVDLRKHGIEAISDVPGVGRNLIDHPVVSIKYRAAREGLSPIASIGPLHTAWIGAQWLFARTGLGARNFWEVGSFFKSSDDVDYVDIQHEFPPVLGEVINGEVSVSDGFQYQVCLMRPRSRGSVSLRSADPEALPAIVTNFLDDPRDATAMVNGVRKTQTIARQNAWDGLRGECLAPDFNRGREAELSTWLEGNVGTQYHPASSCRMGIDDMSVVDQQGRVHGVEALRVIDASIMPSITSGNLHAPTIMMAEKIADRIAGIPRLLPIPVTARTDSRADRFPGA